jgi:hypothetical protein
MLPLMCAAHFITIIYGAINHLEVVLLLPKCKETALKDRTHNEGVIA